MLCPVGRCVDAPLTQTLNGRLTRRGGLYRAQKKTARVEDLNPMLNGIEKLLKTPLGSTVQYRVADDATWSKWAWLEHAELWQAVALHSHLDPDLLWNWPVLRGDIAALQRPQDKPWADPQLAALLLDNIERAVVAVRTFDLPVTKSVPDIPETCTVSFAEFHAWSMRSSLTPIPGFLDRVVERQVSHCWGSYSTPRLEQLAEICELWRLAKDGGPYDPERPWTAPHPTYVKGKLVELGVPDHLLKTFMSIARDPTLPPGPHPVAPKD